MIRTNPRKNWGNGYKLRAYLGFLPEFHCSGHVTTKKAQRNGVSCSAQGPLLIMEINFNLFVVFVFEKGWCYVIFL